LIIFSENPSTPLRMIDIGNSYAENVYIVRLRFSKPFVNKNSLNEIISFVTFVV